MKKIKSITGVITNSSDEVFVLKTSRSLSEVSAWLHENTSGFNEPEVLKKTDGVLKWLVDFGYIIDKDDPESMNKFWIHEVFCKPERQWCEDDEWWNVHSEVIPGGPEINEAWKKFLMGVRDRVNSEYHEKYPSFTKHNPIPTDKDIELIDNPKGWWKGQISSLDTPDWLVQEFLDQYTGPIPESSKIPEDRDADNLEGLIGFSSTDENSIPYEDWDKICNALDGQHWHMG